MKKKPNKLLNKVTEKADQDEAIGMAQKFQMFDSVRDKSTAGNIRK